MNRSLKHLTLTALCGGVLFGCEMDPVTYKQPPSGGASAGVSAGVGAGGAGGAGGGAPQVPDMMVMNPPAGTTPPTGGAGAPVTTCADEPSLDVLASSVGPSLAASCGGRGCHDSGAAFNFRMPSGVDPSTDPFTSEQAQALLEIISGDVRFGEPEGSYLFVRATDTHASTTYRVGSNEYVALYDWIKDGRVCTTTTPTPVEPVGGDEGGAAEGGSMTTTTPSSSTEGFCAALQQGDPRRRPNYYEMFRDEVNPILTSSCAQGGCHAEPSAEYGFWVVSEDDPCSVQANFITSQLYINFLDQLRSPILTAPIDPNHGGYMIFNRGSSSPEYVIIKNWITLGAVR